MASGNLGYSRTIREGWVKIINGNQVSSYIESSLCLLPVLYEIASWSYIAIA